MAEADFTKPELRRQSDGAREAVSRWLNRAVRAEHEIKRLRERLGDALRIDYDASCPAAVTPFWCENCGSMTSQLLYQENRQRSICPDCVQPCDPVQP